MRLISDFQSLSGIVTDGILGPVTASTMRDRFGLNKTQLAHFLGQCHVETGGFERTEENLNYSHVRLLEVFPKYFTPTLATRYQYNPKMIANIAYSNRMGNGDICSGDGFRFRGRGIVQLTGRSNYQEVSNYMGNHSVITDPDVVANELLWEVGLIYFTMRNIWTYAVEVNRERVKQVTLKVNGGVNGLEDRERWTNHYYRVQG